MSSYNFRTASTSQIDNIHTMKSPDPHGDYWDDQLITFTSNNTGYL